MSVQINGWELYPHETRDALKAEVRKKATVFQIATAVLTGEIEVDMNFTPIPDDCQKLLWFSRMLAKALKKAEAEEAAKHFEHWMSGKGNVDAPQLTEEIIKSTSCYPTLINELRTHCCDPNGGTAKEGQQSCSEYGNNWRLHVLLGGYLIHYKMAAKGADECCEVTIDIDDPYDFHFGESATFQDEKKTIIKKAGVEHEITVKFTFRVPDEVLTKLKECEVGTENDPKKPTDFDRKLTFKERICCNEAPNGNDGEEHGGSGKGN
nr:hypothetical protein [uncultured Allomuricauda sp.]